MTPKIARYLADVVPATPCLVLDIDRVAENYRRLSDLLPLVRIYYAVKANPAASVLQRLAGLGSSFDAASWEEIALCLQAGATPEAISFGNTVKKASAIARAHAVGVPMYAFDSIEELEKLAVHAPGRRVYCRIVVENKGADWPLSGKFGTTVENARDLMVRAGELGLDPYGLSFHVGSQQTTTAAHKLAIAQVGLLFTDLQRAGVDVRMVNLGGGLPARYRDEVPELEEFAEAISHAMTRAFGNRLPEMIIEPGRSMVGTAGVLVSEVVLVSRRDPNSPIRWVYLDVGRFGGLAETEGEAIKYRFATPHDGAETGPVAIAGPTCDGVDVLYEKSNYRLPMALTDGDRVEIDNTGAYTTTYCSTAFNGFSPLAEHCI